MQPPYISVGFFLHQHQETAKTMSGTVRADPKKFTQMCLRTGMSLAALAQKAGVDPRTAARLENDLPVARATLRDLAEALGCSPDDLLAKPEGAWQGPDINLAPPAPSLFLGRDHDMAGCRRVLGVGCETDRDVAEATSLTVVRGWPGIGKSCFATAMAQDTETTAYFDSGIFWAFLGPSPDVHGALEQWGRALGIEAPDGSVERAAREVGARLRDARALLVIDDAWEVGHVAPLMIGGAKCATLVTTRSRALAEALVPANQVRVLGPLSMDDGLSVLRYHAPTAAESHESSCRDLVTALEGNPLALRVAGRVMQSQVGRGYDVTQLIGDIASGAGLLDQEVPVDMVDLMSQTTPTVAALLRKSTDLLDEETAERYSVLGVLSARPATFDLEVLSGLWETDDPRPTIDILLDRGLLETTHDGGYQMHALLVTLAHSMLEDHA